MKVQCHEKLVKRAVPVARLPMISQLTANDEIIINSYLFTSAEATSSIITVENFIKQIGGGGTIVNGIMLGVSDSEAGSLLKEVNILNYLMTEYPNDGTYFSIQFRNGHTGANGLFVKINNLGPFEVLYDTRMEYSLVDENNQPISTTEEPFHQGSIPADLIIPTIIYNMVFLQGKLYITGVIENPETHDDNILYVPKIYKLKNLRYYTPEDIYNLYSILVGVDLNYANKIIAMVYDNNYLTLNVKKHTAQYTTFSYIDDCYYNEFTINHNNGIYSLTINKSNMELVHAWK